MPFPPRIAGMTLARVDDEVSRARANGQPFEALMRSSHLTQKAKISYIIWAWRWGFLHPSHSRGAGTWWSIMMMKSTLSMCMTCLPQRSEVGLKEGLRFAYWAQTTCRKKLTKNKFLGGCLKTYFLLIFLRFIFLSNNWNRHWTYVPAFPPVIMKTLFLTYFALVGFPRNQQAS